MAPAAIKTIESVAQAAALMNPLRLRLLDELHEPDSATGLARKLDLPRQKLNYHLRELESQGLVEFVEERRKGNCVERVVRAVARSYVISPSTLGEIGADPDRVEDRLSSAYLVAVAARAIRDLGVLRQRADRAGKKLATLTLQADVRFGSAAEQNAFATELAQVLANLAAKYHDEKAPRGRLFNFFVGGYPAITRGLKKATDETKTSKTSRPQAGRSTRPERKQKSTSRSKPEESQ